MKLMMIKLMLNKIFILNAIDLSNLMCVRVRSLNYILMQVKVRLSYYIVGKKKKERYISTSLRNQSTL